MGITPLNFLRLCASFAFLLGPSAKAAEAVKTNASGALLQAFNVPGGMTIHSDGTLAIDAGLLSLNGQQVVGDGGSIEFATGSQLVFSDSDVDFSGAVFHGLTGTQKTALGIQPLDSDLTSIAALGTTTAGRSLLTADSGSFPAIRGGYFSAARAVAVWDLDNDLPMVTANNGELDLTNFTSVSIDADAKTAMQGALEINSRELFGGDSLTFLGVNSRFSAQANTYDIGLIARGSESGFGSFAAVVEAPNGPGLKISQNGEHTDLPVLFVRRTAAESYDSPSIQVLVNEATPTAPILAVKYHQDGEQENIPIDARGNVTANHIGARYTGGTGFSVGNAFSDGGYSAQHRVTDNAGVITFQNDVGSATGDTLFGIVFEHPYAHPPAVQVMPANQDVMTDGLIQFSWVVITTTGFEVHSNNAALVGVAYKFTYTVTSVD